MLKGAFKYLTILELSCRFRHLFLLVGNSGQAVLYRLKELPM